MNVLITKNGKVLAEIPLSMYPLDVKMPVITAEGNDRERSFTWRLTHQRDESGNTDPAKPKGMQLQ